MLNKALLNPTATAIFGAAGGASIGAGVIEISRGQPAVVLGDGAEGREDPLGVILATNARGILACLTHRTEQFKFQIATGTNIFA